MRLRVLIVDDELIARKRLHRLLSAMPDVEIAGECEDGREVPARIAAGDVDCVLLDVQMREVSGVETLGLIEGGPAVIFVTAHEAHAVAAFDGGAIDYLLKPVEAPRLAKALQRARDRIGDRKAPEKIPVSTRKGVVLLDASEIEYALIEGETVTLGTRRGSFVTDFRIAELERKILRGSFERVHRKALLNLDVVERLEPNESGGYVAHTIGGGRVPVSRQAARRLRRLWDLPRTRD